MFDRSQAQPAQSADAIARAVGALALAALAVIHVVDLPGTLGPLPLIGAGYLGIIVAAVGVGGIMIARSHWLVSAAAGAGRLGDGRLRADPCPAGRLPRPRPVGWVNPPLLLLSKLVDSQNPSP
jgi:hypothetical protein